MFDFPISEQVVQCLEDLNLTHKKARSKFTHEEDLKLSQLVEELGNEDWISISNQMPGRNPRQCRDRWNNYLSPSVVNGPWTNDEEELLNKKYEEYGPSWKCIAKFFPTRTAINVKSRFNLMQRRIKKQELRLKRETFDKKINQKKSPNFADFFYERSFFDDAQNLQFRPQKKKVEKTNNMRKSAVKHDQNKNSQSSLTINSSPLPFISTDKPKNEENENTIDLSNKDNSNSSPNDILNMVLLDIENNEFENFYMWF